MGMTNVTIITLKNLTDIANITSPEQIITNVNAFYGGTMIYLLLWVLVIILTVQMFFKEDKTNLLGNAAMAFGIVTVIGLFFIFLDWINGYQWGSFLVIGLVLTGIKHYIKK